MLAVAALAAATAACAPPARDQASTGPRVVRLVATNFGFDPARIEVRRGELIRFVLENPTDLPHEMFIGSEDEQHQHNRAHRVTEDSGGDHEADGPAAVFVPPRGTAHLDYRFVDISAVIIGCHLIGHWESGMRAEVMFEP
jgi:uncharacterized cupredoxin-like copper-binding protein